MKYSKVKVKKQLQYLYTYENGGKPILPHPLHCQIGGAKGPPSLNLIRYSRQNVKYLLSIQKAQN